MTTLTQASRQWATRPDDERFTSLHELGAYMHHVRDNSASKVVSSRKLTAIPAVDDSTWGLAVTGPNGNPVVPTHWSFSQLAGLAGAPSGYLRNLPSPLSADCLNWGLHKNRDVAEVGVLLTRQPDNIVQLRAATGPNYGRIWNAEIVDALIRQFGDGRTGPFRVPGEFGKDVPITKDNTTLYGSDRDMFVFLADEHNRIDMRDRRDGHGGSLARGFFVSNSETGSASLSVTWFLFDYVCMNRIVWGAQDVKNIRIRHTAGAPDRWLEDIVPVLEEYRNASAAPIEETIANAQSKKLDRDVREFLAERKFTQAQITRAIDAHDDEEGRPIETVWDAVTGVTAAAKQIKWQDERVAMERMGGKLLELVAA